MASCGGKIPLTYSSPNATYLSPYYNQTSSNSLYIYCCWYITSQSGEEVHLSVIDMEIPYGSGDIDVYDYSYDYYYYQAATMSGSLNSVTNILSSRGSLTMTNYESYGYNQFHGGHGVLFQARIMGKNKYPFTGFWWHFPTSFLFLIYVFACNVINHINVLQAYCNTLKEFTGRANRSSNTLTGE